MENKPTWWQMFKIKLAHGKPLATTVDLGRADEVVIRYKDKFISILEDPDTGEIKSLSWTDNLGFIHVNANDFWQANPPKQPKQEKSK